MSKSKIYDKEFKLNAVKLYLTSGRSYSQVGSELGIPEGTLVAWYYSSNPLIHIFCCL